MALGCLGTLFHLKPQQLSLWTAHDRGLVSILLVEGIATLVESVDLRLAFLLIVRIFGQTVCEVLVQLHGEIGVGYQPHEPITLNCTLGRKVSHKLQPWKAVQVNAVNGHNVQHAGDMASRGLSLV